MMNKNQFAISLAGRLLGLALPLVFVATIIIASLKLAGVLAIGWLGVFTPLLIWIGLLLLVFLIGAAATVISTTAKHLKRKRTR